MLIKRVLARICRNCGGVRQQETAMQLLKTAGEIAQAGAQVDIREYVAASPV